MRSQNGILEYNDILVNIFSFFFLVFSFNSLILFFRNNFLFSLFELCIIYVMADGFLQFAYFMLYGFKIAPSSSQTWFYVAYFWCELLILHVQ